MSALGAAFGGITAAAVWYVVVRTAKYGTVDDAMSSSNWNTTNWNLNTTNWESQLDSIALNKGQYYAYIVIGIILSIYALLSVFGFIGSIVRNRALVAFYSTMLWILLLVNLAIGIYNIKSTIDRRNALSQQCKDQTHDSDSGELVTLENKFTTAACSAATKVGIAVGIAIFVVEWLLQLYACVIVKRYVSQLSEEQSFRAYTPGNRVAKGGSEVVGSYYPHQPLGSQVELMPAPGGAYPYNQPDHSFGSKV